MVELHSASFPVYEFDSCVYLSIQSEQISQQMASRAVFKPNCPVVRWDMSSLLVQLELHFFSPFACLQFLPHLVCPIYTSFPVPASHILVKQIWICKCYIKWQSRCVPARTEWGQCGHADTPCMQRKQQGPKWLPPNLPDHVMNAWIFAWHDCLEMNTVNQEISDIYQKSWHIIYDKRSQKQQ